MAFTPEQEAALDQHFNTITTSNANVATALAELTNAIRRLSDQLDERGYPLVPQPSAPPQAAPPLFALPPAPPAPKLPPQPLSSPIPAPSYPPPPRVETIEEVEHKQVYKPLRNIRKQQMRQKHGDTLEKVPTSETHFFEKCIGWPPKFGGIYMSFSRDEEPDAWYTTMLNHSQKLIHASPHLA